MFISQAQNFFIEKATEFYHMLLENKNLQEVEELDNDYHSSPLEAWPLFWLPQFFPSFSTPNTLHDRKLSAADPSAADPFSEFFEADIVQLALAHLPVQSQLGVSRVCKRWHTLLKGNQNIQGIRPNVNINPIISNILSDNFNPKLIDLYPDNEKIMSEFIQWLEHIPLNLLNASPISLRIDEMLTSLCFSRNEKCYDIAKTMLKIYIENTKIYSLKSILHIISASNWLEMTYRIFTYFYINEKLLYPKLRDAIREV